MKKLIIGTLVGGILIFIWSAVSWMMLPTHHDTYKYHPDQDAIMEAIKGRTPDGAYSFPMVDSRNMEHGSAEYQKANEDLWKETIGKPSGMLIWTNQTPDMGPGMYIQGILADWGIALAFCVAVAALGAGASFARRMGMCLVIGLAMLCAGPLPELNWMGFPMHYVKGTIIDIIMETLLAGGFISWLYGRR